ISVTDYARLPRFSQSLMLLPFAIWWTLGGIRAIDGFASHGVWALRDATHLIESLFIWAGFSFGARPGAMERIGRHLPAFLIFAFVYSLLYPFRELLAEYSPVIRGLADYEATLFF